MSTRDAAPAAPAGDSAASPPATRDRVAGAVPARATSPATSSRLRSWLAADRGRAVALVAAALIAGQAGLRAWIALRGYFYLDDFAFTGQAGRHSLTDLHDYLLRPYNNHLMPAAFAQVWVLTKLWPLNFAAVVTVGLVLQALVGTVFYRLLRELFGSRVTVLVPLAVFLFTPITLPAFAWWAAALNQLPQQLALITALWCQTRYLRTARVRVGVYGAVATAAGLLFSEKTLLTVPLVVVFTLFFFADGGLLRRSATVWRAHWRVWVAYLVVAVPYGVYYALEVPSPGRSPAQGGDVAQLIGSAFAHALAPGLLGGPWSWQPIGFAGAIADPARPAMYAANAALIGFVVWTIAWRRRAVFGWAMAVGYAIAVLLLLAFSRAAFVGPFVGDEYRYVTDVAAVGVLGGALAVLRPAGSWQTVPSVPERRAWTYRLTGHRSWDEVRAAVPRPPTGVAVAGLVVAVLVSAGASTVRYDRYWSRNPARAYVSTLRTELAAAPRGLVLVDQPLPPQITWLLPYPDNQLSTLLRPLGRPLHFLRPGRSAASLAVADNQGHLRRVAVIGPGAVAGPLAANGCGWLLGAKPARVRLAAQTVPWTWVLRMGYLASADTSVTLTAGRTTLTVPLKRGLNEVYAQVDGAIGEVDFSALTGGATACTADLHVGRPVPVEGSTP